ncbi:uncharacterized protein EI90DRAFT_3143759 [Cantharellus anzutake]|uniref:uncharacterized protein n=1 Tax=Cantharellus anzutake TaxID=1750568 RepID=UPI00190443F8|nr:uncharacterized protein EI90DRAFT_3143759 [Cantharellus anzutake]KAF8341505.1 hypothetical protein EI90DRAFT_3143759 [Cantharellus anzutake]
MVSPRQRRQQRIQPQAHRPLHHSLVAQNSSAGSNTNGPSSSTVGGGTGGSGGTQSSSAQQEEISTIFVVGFPDDMQEREFQNMFTFSHGFEAATLKIPNKESTSYGAGSNLASSSSAANAAGISVGASDPYNLVTVNSGGVVLDSRDGTTTTASTSGAANSWTDDTLFTRNDNASSNATMQPPPAPGPAPPRKQIIGFAKFATRADAIAARDTLQSKRVDVEKGAVLKAEMAKKNLHTKRGVGVGGTGGPSSGGGSGSGPSGSTHHSNNKVLKSMVMAILLDRWEG